MRTAGRSGLRVSALALGTHGWGTDVDPHLAAELLSTYRESGGTMIDTAYGYGDGASEEIVGALVGTDHRDDLVLCTKSGLSRDGDGVRVDTSRGGLLRQLDTSLSRLRTDYVDLWMVHAWSDEVPLTETLSALEHAVRTGRARYVGVSGFHGWQLARAASLLEQVRVPLVASGVEYNLLERWPEHELAAAAAHLGTGVFAWSPLAGGVLSGKYRHGVPAQSRAAAGHRVALLREGNGPVVEALVTAAEGLGVTATEVALAWIRDRPGVSAAAVGARTLIQLQAALRSDALTIPDEVGHALDEVSS
ncbi:aldo/keto reductase [Leekyejoonella antrihumi]|uniref:Aldo/keto reductase n=1 Tax=Leekyejoonella antrihumi TaxID=1660198 RepID=A0A563DU57_9MICO|nr:aldo/keto reductase [Leekyejoonella antrihumi]TWP33224.1 aldo/keto reductase [Leekyejoonella antrihumi]